MKILSTFLFAILALIVPATAVAETYVLVITTKDGRKVEFETQNIESMEVVEKAPTPLAVPEVKVVNTSAGELSAQWAKVEGAERYAYSIDGASETSTTATSISLKHLKPGSHTLTVAALPSNSTSGRVRSADCRVEFQVTFQLTITQGAVTQQQAEFTFAPSHADIAYLAAVIPASIASDSERMTKVRELAATNASMRHTGRATVQFTGLTSGESYQVVAFAEKDQPTVYSQRFMTTSDSYKPGELGYVFPPGVNLDSGWIDVDKVGKLDKYGYTGNDEELCWACSTAGMIQWWLNDYKRATGSDYPLRIALPEVSKCYSTPVMDVLAQAFYHDAGNPSYVMQWFFTGMPNAINSYNINGHSAFNTSYVNVQGNFANMPKEDYEKYISKELNSYFLYNGLTENEVKVKASADIIGWLKKGPLYIAINGGNHALTCWGVKYTVDVKGNPIITRLYYAENDLMAGNIKGGLNESGITWKAGDGPHMTSTNGLNVEINGFIHMKGHSTIK